MNFKLVVVWVFAILIFMTIGMLGFFNRNLLVEPDTEVYTPIKNDIVTRNCYKNLSNGKSSYIFYFDKSNNINRVSIKYEGNSANPVAYQSATTLKNLAINGITTTLTGSLEKFTFIMNADLKNYDKDKLATVSNDLINLSILINDISNYDSYKSALNNLDVNNSYTCN